MESLLILIQLIVASKAFSVCLNYESEQIKLRAILLKETHPGPPNYKYIAQGDRKEIIWIVKLGNPIGVNGMC